MAIMSTTLRDNSSNPSTSYPSNRIRHRKRSNEVIHEADNANGSHLLVDDQNKYKSMRTRALSTVWMLGVFALIIYMGHLYIWAMIIAIQIFMVREVFNLARKVHEDIHLPGFRILNWHFFFTTMIFVYGYFLRRQLVNTVLSDKFLYRLVSSFIKYQLFICYFLYISGFVWFILTLKIKMYKYQFGQFAWTHMILLVVFTQSAFTVANIFEGIFWFLLPAFLIVINDIAAYIFGFFFGRTPLIKLSPKKTWEGFIGASVTTIISAFLLANFLGRFQWLTCPRKDLSTGWLHCDPGPLFKPKYYSLGMFPSWRDVVGGCHAPIGLSLFTVFLFQRVHWALYLCVFSLSLERDHSFSCTMARFSTWSICIKHSTFWRLFASGFKRAFKIKDFGDSIPGHGGMTDRMDCQMVMAVFSYIYYQSFIVPHNDTVETILQQILGNLSIEDQIDLYRQLGDMLMAS